MAKAKLKTQETKNDVHTFLKKMSEQTQSDCNAIIEMMKKASAAEPKMWGSAIIGFGNMVLKYESGRELDWFMFGLSPRKQNLTLYGLLGPEADASLLKDLGKHKTGKGCLYINKLSDVNTAVLKKLIEKAAKKKLANC